jgi:AcrR family transcriptional regulator
MRPEQQQDGERRQDLREACVTAAHEVIAERGIEHLSLRDVARRLGVSHQAPYRHYPSRDHLLAAVLERCFTRFSTHLDARSRGGTAAEDLAALGRAYLEFAIAEPLEYRLMFSTPWPSTAQHPTLASQARHAFDILVEVLERVHVHHADATSRARLDALFVWSTMHGLASILASDALHGIGLPDDVVEQTTAHVMSRIACGIKGE